MKKVFRISEIECAKQHINNPRIAHYKLEQRFGLIFHFWGSPSFAPPHLFPTDKEAFKCAKEHYPNCVVYDNYSGAKTKG